MKTYVVKLTMAEALKLGIVKCKCGHAHYSRGCSIPSCGCKAVRPRFTTGTAIKPKKRKAATKPKVPPIAECPVGTTFKLHGAVYREIRKDDYVYSKDGKRQFHKGSSYYNSSSPSIVSDIRLPKT